MRRNPQKQKNYKVSGSPEEEGTHKNRRIVKMVGSRDKMQPT